MSDWFYFGLTEDLLKIFDIPLMSEEWLKGPKDGGYYSVLYNCSAEQYLWFTFLSKYKSIPFKSYEDISNNNIETSEKYLANNSIILSAWRVGIDCLKYPGASYAQIPCLSYSGLYTYNDYRKMLNKYANNNLLIIPNLAEDLVYFVVYNLRFWLKQRSPKLHDFIARTVNRKNHRSVKAAAK
jgi:hypothetical protein